MGVQSVEGFCESLNPRILFGYSETRLGKESLESDIAMSTDVICVTSVNLEQDVDSSADESWSARRWLLDRGASVTTSGAS